MSLVFRLQIAGIPNEGVSRETLKEKLAPYGVPKFVDFRFGAIEAWVRWGWASQDLVARSNAGLICHVTLCQHVYRACVVRDRLSKED